MPRGKITLTGREVYNAYTGLAKRIDNMLGSEVNQDLWEMRYQDCIDEVESSLTTLRLTINHLEEFKAFLGRLK